jgi:hypothetical protein
MMLLGGVPHVAIQYLAALRANPAETLQIAPYRSRRQEPLSPLGRAAAGGLLRYANPS